MALSNINQNMKKDKQMPKIEQLSKQAQRYASQLNQPMAVFNLNRIGSPMYVIRPADSFPNEDRMIAGPFMPQPETVEA
jgi:hypothetical protein